MKKLKGKKTTMRGITDRQLVGAIRLLDERLIDLGGKHNQLADATVQQGEKLTTLAGAVAFCLHKLGHPHFADPKFASFGLVEADGSDVPPPVAPGIVLTDAFGVVKP